MKHCLSLLLSFVLFIACSPDNRHTEQFAFHSASPELHGFDPDSLEQITLFLEQAVEQQWIPGAVAMIARDGAIVYEATAGYSDLEQETPLHTDDIFRLASMTKAITSTAILKLADRNQLNLNDPVSMYIPEFSDPRVVESVDFTDSTWTARPAEREVTIHDLLTHTSGIAYGFADTTMNVIYSKAGVPDAFVADQTTIEETMAILGGLPLKHDPGQQWTYGLNTDILGRVVEVVSDQPLDRFFRTEIFEPLGMEDTGFSIPRRKANRLVPLYRNPESHQLEKLSETSLGEAGTVVSTSKLFIGGATYFSGGAGLVGTALDYLRFMQMVLNRGRLGETTILSEETAQLLHENQLGDLRINGDGFSYGFLVTLEEGNLNYGREPGRLGWGGIFQTIYWMYPDSDLSVVLMSQVYPSQHRQQLYNGFEERVNGAFKWEKIPMAN